jgi:protein-disulfide isomerase
MKRSYLLLSILSFIGIVITTVMLMDYYEPSTVGDLLSCGGGDTISCSTLPLSPYKLIFGVPLGAIAFFTYLWIFLSLHLFKESGKNYWNTFVYFLLPLIVFYLAFNVVVSAVMAFGGIVCKFCVGIIINNIVITIIAYLEYKSISTETGISLKQGIVSLPKYVNKNEDRIFSSGTAVYYTVLLFLVVISFSLYLGEKYENKPKDKAKQSKTGSPSGSDLDKYKQIEIKEYNLPGTKFVAGDKNAPVMISVFTDPLCSACKSFHSMEKEILKKYKGKVQIHTYYFPDSSCNKNNLSPSCRAALMLFAADRAGRYDQTVERHFENYAALTTAYKEKASDDEIAKVLSDDADFREKLLEAYSQDDLFDLMNSHVKIGNGIKISATPTLIINGRLMKGFPRFESMSQIIEFELKR